MSEELDPIGPATFRGTDFTHEIVVNGARYAFATSRAEAKTVACALSRATTGEVRVYAAYASLPYTSYRNGSEVK